MDKEWIIKIEHNGRVSGNKSHSFDAIYFAANLIKNRIESDGVYSENDFKNDFLQLIIEKFNITGKDENYYSEIVGVLKFSGIIDVNSDGNVYIKNIYLFNIICESMEGSIAFQYVRACELGERFMPGALEYMISDEFNELDFEKKKNIIAETAYLFWENYNEWWISNNDKNLKKTNFINDNAEIDGSNIIEINGMKTTKNGRRNFVNLFNYHTLLERNYVITTNFNFNNVSDEIGKESLEFLTANKNNTKANEKENSYLEDLNIEKIFSKINEIINSGEIKNISDLEDGIQISKPINDYDHGFTNEFVQSINEGKSYFWEWLNKMEEKLRREFSNNLLQFYLENEILFENVYEKFSIEICDGAHIYPVSEIKRKIESIFLRHLSAEEIKTIKVEEFDQIFKKNFEEINMYLNMISDHNNGIYLDKNTHWALDNEYISFDLESGKIKVLIHGKGFDELEGKELNKILRANGNIDYLKK